MRGVTETGEKRAFLFIVVSLHAALGFLLDIYIRSTVLSDKKIDFLWVLSLSTEQNSVIKYIDSRSPSRSSGDTSFDDSAALSDPSYLRIRVLRQE